MKTISLRSGHALATLCIVALPLVGCQHDAQPQGEGDGSSGTAGVDSEAGSGDATGGEGGDETGGGEVDVIPAPGGMRRLTPSQYVKSVEVLLGTAAAEAAQPPPLPELGHFDSHTAVNEPLTPVDIESYESSAMAIGEVVRQDPSTLSERVPCVSSGQDASCYEAVASELGRLAWRRPLGEDEIRESALAYFAADKETIRRRSSHSAQHLLQPVVPRDRGKTRRIKRIDTNVDRAHPRIAPFGRALRQAVTVGGHGDPANTRHSRHSARDLGKIGTQGRLAAGQSHFPKPQTRECSHRPAHLLDRKLDRPSFRFSVAFGQAIGATEIANVGNRQAQIFEPSPHAVG